MSEEITVDIDASLQVAAVSGSRSRDYWNEIKFSEKNSSRFIIYGGNIHNGCFQLTDFDGLKNWGKTIKINERLHNDRFRLVVPVTFIRYFHLFLPSV